MKKISKNTMLLAGAVLLGVLCFVGAQYYLRSYLSNAEQRLVQSYKTKKVIVASAEIPAGVALSTDNLAVRAIPERYLASTVLGPDELATVEGQKVVVALKPGDPIDRGALERADSAALSSTVAKGERAITFAVDEISSISGMLVPGDTIDLLYTGPGTTANSYTQTGEGGAAIVKDQMHVRVLLQSVLVMATGKTTQKRVVRTEAGGEREVNVDFTTVTLKVSPAQAEQVLLGQKLGSLTAVLRNPGDGTRLGKAVLDESTFKQVEPAPRAGVGSYVEMIIGGSGGAVRTRAEDGGAPMAVAAANSVAAGGARAAAAPPPPRAGDVQSRLGIATPPSVPSTTTVTFPFAPTK